MFKYSVTATVNCRGYRMKVSYGQDLRNDYTDDESVIWSEIDDVYETILKEYKASNVLCVTESVIAFNENGKIQNKRSITLYPANNMKE